MKTHGPVHGVPPETAAPQQSPAPPAPPTADAEEFVRARLESLRRFAYLISGSAAEADDLAQIAVIEVWRRWPVTSGNPEAYARRVIVTRNVSRWRRWRREILVGANHLDLDDPASERVSDPDLWQALRTLRVLERTVVVLHVLYGYTFEEIALVVGEPRGTVSSRYSRARTALRAALTTGAGSGTARQRAARQTAAEPGHCPEPGIAWLARGTA